MTLDVHTLDQVLLVGAGVLLLAILAVRLSVGVGLPSLLVYLLMGVALGESGIGLAFDDAELAHALGFAALILILAEGGLTTSWPDIKPVMRLGVSLATIGVGVSVLVMAIFGHYVLGLSWELAVLLGAITSPTDAAAVFSVLRQVPLPRRLTGALEAESGLNDAPTIVLVTLISSQGGDSILEFAGVIAWELVVGTLGGLIVGYGGAWLLRRSALPSSGLYPLTVLAFTVLAYAGTAALHGSGFAAVYVSALILGNAELPHRQATRSFSEGVAWLAQIGLFVMLGLLVSPDRIDLADRRHRHRGGAGPDAARATDLGGGRLARAADGTARAGLPLVGRSARCGADRPGHDPAGRSPRRGHAALRHRLRDGGDLHAVDRPDPAPGREGAQGGPSQRAA